MRLSTPSRWLNQNPHGSGMAESYACAVDLADKRSGSADFGNVSGLAETHFTDSLAKVGIAREFADTSHRAGGKLAERQRGIDR